MRKMRFSVQKPKKAFFPKNRDVFVKACNLSTEKLAFFGKKRFSGNSTLQFNRGTTPISLEIGV